MLRVMVTTSTEKWSLASSEGDDPDAFSSGYTGSVITIFGHLKGQQNANEMQDLNVQAAVGSRIYSEMQESEKQMEMQESLLLLTLGENKVIEICDSESASNIEEMDGSDNAGTSTQLQVNEKNDSEMADSEK